MKEPEDFERTIAEAMRIHGWILPQTAHDVEKAEEELRASPIDLPPPLVDPFALLSRQRRGVRLKSELFATIDSGLEENLAQAAREGKDIPPNIRQRMRMDREAAQKETDE